MPKAVATSQTLSSPESSENASVDPRINPSSNAGTPAAPSSATTVPLHVVTANSVYCKLSPQTHVCVLANRNDHEHHAIAASEQGGDP